MPKAEHWPTDFEVRFRLKRKAPELLCLFHDHLPNNPNKSISSGRRESQRAELARKSQVWLIFPQCGMSSPNGGVVPFGKVNNIFAPKGLPFGISVTKMNNKGNPQGQMGSTRLFAWDLDPKWVVSLWLSLCINPQRGHQRLSKPKDVVDWPKIENTLLFLLKWSFQKV